MAVCLGLVMAALMGEIGVRLFYPPDCNYVFDPYVGVRLPPSSFFFGGNEGRIWVRTSRQGLRDREHSLAKPPNVYRIVVLGDSFSEAVQVNQSETFWSVLESGLNADRVLQEQTVEVINFGVSGYGTVQEWQTLKHYAGQFQPDLVLLALFPGNDVRNNSRKLETQVGTPFARIENGELKFDPIANPIPPGSWLWVKDTCVKWSRLLRLIYRTKAALQSRAQTATATPLTEPGLDIQAFIPPPDAAWTEAWEITRLALRETQNEAKRLTAKFVVAVVTNPIEVSVDTEQETALKRQLNVEDFGYADRRLDEISREFDFPVVHLTPEFRKRARDEHVWFHGFPETRLGTGHWNRDGHRFAGEILTRELPPLIRP
ncbi:MAG: SGNH/GDSL hydrolase family protein [Planctomycetes bacterium]|nr:SGNH/GDSL hydrolase family protein [Planctomycetota bacterium]